LAAYAKHHIKNMKNIKAAQGHQAQAKGLSLMAQA
jgi:hypothetical protein